MTREHTPQPGVTWEQRLAQLERVVCEQDDGESPFGWREPAKALPEETNRAGRRALKRANRRSST